MLLTKLKSTTAILLAMAVVSVGAGIGMSTLSAWGQDQKPSIHNQPSKAATAEGTKQTAKQGHIFLFRQHDPNPNLPSVGENEPHIAMVSPDSKEVTWLTKNLRSEVQPNHPSPVAVSPDGRLIAYVVWPNKVFVKAVDNQKPAESLGVRGGYCCWSPDSRSLVVTAMEGTSVSNQIIDLETKGRKSLNLPKLKVTDNVERPMGHLITDWSRDGKWFLTTLMASKLTNWMTNSELYLVKWDGSDAKKIGQGFEGKLSPDGKTVLCLDLAWKDEVLFTHLVLVDVKSGERRRISRETNGTLVGGYCWSPDGKKIAYVWQRNPADGEKEYEFFLMVMDADGQNATVVLSQKTSDRYVPFGSPDWR